MKIGVWLKNDYRPEEGGGFSYYDNLIRALDAHPFGGGLEIAFVATGSGVANNFSKEFISLPWERQLFRRILRKLATRLPMAGPALVRRIDAGRQAYLRRKLKAAGIDVLYYPLQMDIVLPGFPYIATSWDIGHLNTWPFPEMTNAETAGPRRLWYREVLPNALMVFAESEAGKRELASFLGIPPGRIRVIPMFCGRQGPADSPVTGNEAVHSLEPGRFYFYPAQFWPHKNHVTLLHAFAQIARGKPDLRLVLTGSDKGNLDLVKTVIRNLDLTEKVVLPGFVDQAVIDHYYRHAAALVMPTFLGPTNIPLLEALAAGCPVICSDLEGHREMLGEAALYFDPSSEDQLAACMLRALDPDTRKALLNHQDQVRQTSIFTLETALHRMETAWCELSKIRRNWA